MGKYKTEREYLSKTLLKDGDYKTTKEVFLKLSEAMPETQIFAELNSKKEIVYHNAKEVCEDFLNIGAGLIAAGLEDQHIAIIADNSYNYVMTDVAIAAGVGVVTPIDKNADAELMTTLIKRCDATAIICSVCVLDRIKNILKKCAKIKTIITIDKKAESYLCLSEIKKLGAKTKNYNYFKNKEIDRDKVCEILFTSGTTGANKGVMFNQKNLVANIVNCLDVIQAENKNNTSMSILPMHHATEINTHIMPRVAAGRLTYISENMKDMMTNIKIFKPFVITVVPMVANAFYKNIWMQATKVGKAEKLKKGIKLCKMLGKLGIDITHKLFKDVYAPFGGNLKQIVCGGAPLNPEVVSGLRDLGIYINNGFGITECGPLVSMNTDTYNDVDSIGKAAPKLSVKIFEPDEDGVGELCVKGDSVALGYYKDDKATKEVFDKDGYFHTGDLITMSNDGRMYIAGRKKNLIVLSNGKNVFPEELELAVVNNIKYVKEVVVFEGDANIAGEKKRVICAEVVLDSEAKVDEESIRKDFIELNKKLGTYKRIAYVDVLDREFEKNASRKILRQPAIARHNEDNGIII